MLSVPQHQAHIAVQKNPQSPKASTATIPVHEATTYYKQPTTHLLWPCWWLTVASSRCRPQYRTPSTLKPLNTLNPRASKSTASDDRRLAPDDRRLPPDDRRLPPDDRRLAPDDRRLPPDDRRLPPDDRRLAPDDRRLPPDDRRLAPDDRRLPPDDRRLHPAHASAQRRKHACLSLSCALLYQ
jgi:hypothetical protein